MSKEKKYNRLANISLGLAILLMGLCGYFLTQINTNPDLWVLSMLSVLGSLLSNGYASKYDKKYRAMKKSRIDYLNIDNNNEFDHE